MANNGITNNNAGNPNTPNQSDPGIINNPGTDNVEGITVDSNSNNNATPQNGNNNSGTSNSNLKKDKKYLGESTLLQDPTKKLTLQLKDGSVTTSKLADGAVTMKKTLGIQAYIDNKGKVLQTQINSILRTLSSIGQGTAYDLTSEEGIVRLLMFIDDGQPYPAVVGSIPNGAIWYSPDDGLYHVWQDTTPEGEIEQTGTWEEWIPTGKEIFFDLTTNKLKRYDTETYTLVDLVSSGSEDSRILPLKAWVDQPPYISYDSNDPESQQTAWEEAGYTLGDYILSLQHLAVFKLIETDTRGWQFSPIDVPEEDWKFVYDSSNQTLGICVNIGSAKGQVILLGDYDYINNSIVDHVKVESYNGTGIAPAGKNVKGVYISTVNKYEEETEAGLIPYATASSPGVMAPEDKNAVDTIKNLLDNDEFATRSDILSIVNTNTFNSNSDDPASQKTIATFINNLFKDNKGKVLIPTYCCIQSELPIRGEANDIWFDTAYNKLYKKTLSGWSNYAAVGEALIVCMLNTHEPYLYVQTSETTSYVVSLLGGGTGNGNGLVYYAPTWQQSREITRLGDTSSSDSLVSTIDKIEVGSTFFNETERKLYIQESTTSYKRITTGTYLLSKPTTPISYYLFDASNSELVQINAVDSELSTTSANPVQNKAVATAINNLEEWKGRVILVDRWGAGADAYIYYYNPTTKILKKREGNKITEYSIGIYLLVSPSDGSLYLYNAATKSDTKLADSFTVEEIGREISGKANVTDVENAIRNVTGKVVSVRRWGPNGAYSNISDWKDNEYYFNTTTKKLWLMGTNNQPKTEVGKAGETYILVDKTYSSYNYYVWNVGSNPIQILTGNDGQSYATKTDFEYWKSRPIAVDYWTGSTPVSPSAEECWYNPSTKKLKYFIGGAWNDLLPDFTLDSTYLLFNKQDNCLYIAPNNGNVLKYPIGALQNIYLNGTLVPTREVGGNNAVELNIDPSIYDATINKGEIISPYWGTLTGEEELLEGDYNLDANNDLYKYVDVEGTLTWVEITSGSYILRKEENSSEYIYLYTVGEEPIKMATYNDIASHGGGTITGVKRVGESSNFQVDANGVVILPYFVESSALGSYATRSELGAVTGSVSGLRIEMNLIDKHGKAVCISEEVSLDGDPISTSYSSYVSGDALSLVMSTDGVLLLKVVRSGTTYYYSTWNDVINTIIPIYLPGSSKFETKDLFFLQDESNLVFWIWDGTKYAKTVNIGDISNKADKTELDSLPKVIALEELLSGNTPTRTWNDSDINKYRIKNADISPVLEQYAGSGSFTTISDYNLYILYYNRRLYYFKNSEALGRTELISFPNSADYSTLEASIPSKVLEVLHFGTTSNLGTIDYVEGDLWYDDSQNVKQLQMYDGEEFVPYTSNTSPLILLNKEDNKLYSYIDGVGVHGAWSGGSEEESTGNGSIVFIQFVRSGVSTTDAEEGDYSYNPTNKVLSKLVSEAWSPVTTDKNVLYITPSPDDISDSTYKSYGNIVYRGTGGTTLAPLTNDDELAETLATLAETLNEQAAALSSITGLGGALPPDEGTIIGQCYFYTGDNNTGKPYWWNGTDWVDIEGTPL